MGNLVRQYWIPVMLSEELAEADGAPLRVRLLCEDLIMFRDTSGRVGLLEDHCSHRGASLFFGRNEENGLRCVYHGWKYDVSGQCVDMPNEPPETSFAEKIHHHAYPCVEYGGMIWAYLGPRSQPPELPKLEWATVPAEHRNLSPVVRECNWVQALEGDIDTAHLYFLHARLDGNEDRGPQNDNGVFHEDRHPRLHLVDKPYGLVYGAQRDEGSDKYYWRITQFMFPFHTFFPPGGFSGVPGHIWVPLDDYHTMVWSVSWNPIEPLIRRQQWSRPDASQYLPATSDGMGRWRSPINKGNDYMIDRDLQSTKTFTGIPSIPMQDQAVTESMGPIYDRSQEHLGSTDAMIMQVRRKLIEAAKAFEEEGVTPPCVDQPELYGIRSASLVLDRQADWTQETKELLKAFTGLPVATV
jgi:nitrite reductase/ring-hydroxylating ferredoxin subunit